MSEPSAQGASPADDRRRRAAARAARNARRVPRVARRAVGGVLGRRAHRELVGVRLAEHARGRAPAARGDGRVEHRHVVLEDLRACRRAEPARRDHVLERDRHAVAVGSSSETSGTRAARRRRVDRGAVGVPELARTRPPRRSSRPRRVLGGRGAACRSRSLPGGVRNKSSSRSGAFANASSSVSQTCGSSSAHAFAISSGCDVGGTSERSSSETFETASRIAESCSWKRVTSSSDSSSRASRATCRTSSLVDPRHSRTSASNEGPLSEPPRNSVPKG